jgi:serine/threonine protein kinase
VLKAIRPVVHVLAEMHSKGFTHRDFKPGNIFVGKQGELVLGDAGLAYYENGKDARVSKTFENVGTREYMPAWAMSRRTEIRPTFDVFSVGKVLWAMIAGQPTVQLWYIHEEHSELTTLFPENGAILWANELLNKCVVEKESEMKIQDAAQLLEEIDRIIEAIEVKAVVPALVHSIRRGCRVCWVGEYTPVAISIGNDRMGRQGKTYQCNQCGHLELFGALPLT